MNVENTINKDEVSLKEIFQIIGSYIAYLISNWWKILIVGILGAILAGFYTYIKPIKYTAEMSFVVEEGKSSGGGLASLAGQFGFDVGGATGATLFSGDNILMFLKSSSLTKETLLTTYDSVSEASLADKYAEVNGLRNAWKENKKIGKDIYFPSTSKAPFTRLQDSLLNTIINKILKTELLVDRPEKKSTFLVVTTSLGDEKLAKFFCERLVQKATDRYVTSKISRQKSNVDRLAKRADSIERVLNGRTFATAQAQEKILDVNPGDRTVTVNAEVSNRDKMMLTQIYGEVIKNLEISKMQLSQETPTIQIVDLPSYPLPKTRVQLILFGLIGFIACSFLSSIYFIVKKLIQ